MSKGRGHLCVCMWLDSARESDVEHQIMKRGWLCLEVCLEISRGLCHGIERRYSQVKKNAPHSSLLRRSRAIEGDIGDRGSVGFPVVVAIGAGLVASCCIGNCWSVGLPASMLALLCVRLLSGGRAVLVGWL
jgi:hypothetical protein